MKVIWILLLLGIALEGAAKPKWKHKMADPTQLASGLIGYWNLDQNFDEHFPAHDSVPPNAHPLTSNPATPGIWPSSGVGVSGGCAEFSYDNLNGNLAYSGGDPVFLIGTEDRTFVIRFKMNAFDSVKINKLFGGGGFGYSVYLNASRQVEFTNPFVTVTHPTELALNTWYCIILTHNVTTEVFTLSVNGVIVTGNGAGLPFIETFFLGFGLDGCLDEFGIWNRVLTDEEKTLINSSAITYTDIVPPELPPGQQCRTVQCCEDNVFAYTSARGSGGSFDSACFPPAEITFAPNAGEVVIMPTLVVMSSSIPGAVIRYTLDGTDPDSTSTIFTTPLTIDNPVTEIRARAFVTGCPDGPVASAQYQAFPQTSEFAYLCDTPDEVGSWGVFVPDAINDYHWRVNISFPTITSIQQIDVRQLDVNGKWTTGQSWSTREYPFPATPTFRSFPLLLKIGGVAQNNAYTNDYSASFGTFAAASHAIDLYGEPVATLPSSHMFEILITLGAGSEFRRVAKVIGSGCVPVPPPCQPPHAPLLSPSCTIGGVRVLSIVPIGATYQIWRSASPTTGFVSIHSDTSAAIPQTYDDLTAVHGQSYWYQVSQTEAGCVELFSTSVNVTMQSDPTAHISASPATIDPGQSSTISWDSQNVVGNVTLTAPIGVQPGNLAGSQVVSPGATTTYHITGSNTCGAFDEQVTVNVSALASCGASQPTVVEIVGYNDLFFDVSACALLTAPAGFVVPWAGRFNHLPSVAACSFFIGQGKFAGGKWLACCGITSYTTETKIIISGGAWNLYVYGIDALSPVVVWRGTKATGDTPVGTYTRVSGCSSTPSSLVIAIV